MAATIKYLIFSLALLIGVLAPLAESRVHIQRHDAAMLQRYQDWLVRYRRQYTTLEEMGSRYQIFAENDKRIDASNAANEKPYKLGLNRFADLTDEEFQALLGFRSDAQLIGRGNGASFRYGNVSASTLPSSVDWRKKGAVTPVKDQGTCGACWSFSAVAAVEGITKIKTGRLVSLSEQELMDCDRTDINQGCEGGMMDNAFEFIEVNGLTTEDRYPYLGTDGNQCKMWNSNRAATITGHEDVPVNDENALLKAVAHQPVSVAIEASGSDFRFYESGLFTGYCETALDHGVTVVGYGESEDGIKYWLVKNSWGAEWGEEGYIRMQRDIDDPVGLCGITKIASYPISS